MDSKSDATYETDNRTGINHGGQMANTPVERLTASSIVGDPIAHADGKKLGAIENLVINIKTGMVEYALVEFGSFLGVGGKLFAIPFTELTVNPEKRLFVLDRERAFLEKVPGFDKSRWPDVNHPYYEEVNAYWQSSPSAPVP